MLKYIRITNDCEIEKFCSLASDIWHEYFPFLISEKQIDYMLDKFQSPLAVKAQHKAGYEYYFIEIAGTIAGYVVFKPEKDYLFLSKLYFIKEFRGKGFGRKTLNFLGEKAKEADLSKIRLTVNKHNENSIAAYKKWGLKIIASEIFDIGSGYIMDDYIMEMAV